MEHRKVENKKVKKILFVTTAYPRSAGDVITPWLVELIQRIRAKGLDVSVFTSSYMGLKNQVLNGVPVYRFRYFLKKYERLTHEETAVDRFDRGPLNKILSICYIVFGSIAISRLTRSKKFDIVHVNWPFPHIVFGIIACLARHTALFLTFFGIEIRWLKNKFKYLIKPFSFLTERADVITTISNHTAHELAGITRKNVLIIPFSAAVKEKVSRISDDKEIIFVGRAVERKGVNFLIDAFNQVMNEIPHKLIIIGDGPERKRWEEQARRLGRSDRIIFTGMIDEKAKNEYYRKCSFFVLPAVVDKHGDVEGLGVVIIEAMSYSKPAIASNIGGITDIVVDGENGLLVEPAQPAALAAAIKNLALNPQRSAQMGRRAKEIIDERFNWDKITERIIEQYEKYS